MNIFRADQLRKLPDGNHSDGGGLVLQVKGDSRRWYFRYTQAGRTQYVAIGSIVDRSLADARKLASEYRNLIASGLDPKLELERRANEQQASERAKRIDAQRASATLEAVARAYHAAHVGDWTQQHGGEWLRSLELHVFGKLGSKPVADIKPADLLDVLLPLKAEKPETASRVRERLDTIFADALVREVCDANPAAAIAKAMREKRGARKARRKHFASLDWRKLPAFIAELRNSDRVGIAAARALEFAILTASRTKETLEATWGEVDLDARRWTIPKERMKAREAHVVHLSDRALEILREVRKLRATDAEGKHRPSDVVFPSPQRATKPLSNMALLMALGRLGYWGTEVAPEKRITVHGLCRSTLSTWANEKGYARDVVEATLAHNEADAVRRAYNHAQHIAERRRLLNDWAAYCGGEKTKQRRLRVVEGAAA